MDIWLSVAFQRSLTSLSLILWHQQGFYFLTGYFSLFGTAVKYSDQADQAFFISLWLFFLQSRSQSSASSRHYINHHPDSAERSGHKRRKDAISLWTRRRSRRPPGKGRDLCAHSTVSSWIPGLSLLPPQGSATRGLRCWAACRAMGFVAATTFVLVRKCCFLDDVLCDFMSHT